MVMSGPVMCDTRPVRLLLIGPLGNGIGRTYCLHLLAKHLGWESEVYAIGDWSPVADDDFRVRSLSDLNDDVVAAADAAIVYGVLPWTLGAVLPMAERVGTAVIVDVDDPQWERWYGYTPLHRMRVILALLRRARSPIRPYTLRRKARRLPMTVASPFVADRWPGAVIPHVREPPVHRDLPPLPLRTAFVGTPRGHKGLEAAREAAAIAGVGLTITADPPKDPRQSEQWVGTTTLHQGLRIVAKSHVALVPSIDTPWSRRQFPVKVVDAMISGRVVVGSDLPPIRWAVGDTGLLVPPGDVEALCAALRRLQESPDLLARLGAAARERAIDLFTPEAVAPRFAEVVRSAVT